MAIKDNLISCWEMDESSGNAVDAHSNGYNLTDNNTVQATTGVISGARLFAPANTEYFSKTSNADLQTGDIDFTLAAWVYMTGTAATQCAAAKYTTTGNQREYSLVRIAGNSMRFQVSATGNSTVTTTDTTSLSNTTWYWITAGHDATGNVIWIAVNNGTPVTAAHSTGVYTGTGDFTVGSINAGSAWLWDGNLDQIALWKRDLRSTPDDMTEIYNSGSGLAYSSWDAGGATAVPVFAHHYRTLARA